MLPNNDIKYNIGVRIGVSLARTRKKEGRTMVYGWRGKIGLIYLAPGVPLEIEAHKMVPEGVAILTTRIPHKMATPEELMKLANYIEEASSLLAQAKPDLIVFGCTAGSFIRGIGYDKEIINKIESHVGIPAITTSTAAIDSLNALKVKKLAVATPYIDEVNQHERSFIEDSGFKITSIKGLGLLGNMAFVENEQMYRLAKEVFTEDADALFISCTGLSVIGIIETLEEELKRPVVTSNQATIWAALRRINVRDKIKGFGTLFRMS